MSKEPRIGLCIRKYAEKAIYVEYSTLDQISAMINAALTE